MNEYVSLAGRAALQQRFRGDDEWRGVLNVLQGMLQSPHVDFARLLDDMRRGGLVTDEEPVLPPEPPKEAA